MNRVPENESLTKVRKIWTSETVNANFVPAEISEEQRKEHLREQAMLSRQYTDHIALVQGEILYEIFANEYYMDWGYRSFKDYVEQELEFKLRKASYLLKIYNRFIVELDVEPLEIIDIPWSTLKELLPAVDEKNVEKLIEYAKDHNMGDVRKLVKKELGEGSPQIPEKQRRFLLTEDQDKNVDRAFRIAEIATGSDKPGYLLDVIATEFNTSNLAQEPSPENMLGTIEEYVDTLKRVFGVDIQIKGIDDTCPAFATEDDNEEEEE